MFKDSAGTFNSTRPCPGSRRSDSEEGTQDIEKEAASLVTVVEAIPLAVPFMFCGPFPAAGTSRIH